MRVKHKVSVSIDETTEGKDFILFPDDVSSEVVIDGFTQAQTQRTVLVINEVFSVALGAVTTAKGIYIKSTGDFDVVLNGSTALQVRRGTLSVTQRAAYAKLFIEANIASVEITAVEALTMTTAVWGEPVA